MSGELTVANELIVPAAVGVTVTLIVATPLNGSAPRLPITVPPASVTVPCDATAETNTTEPGKKWVTTTFVAALGPLFVTEIV